MFITSIEGWFEKYKGIFQDGHPCELSGKMVQILKDEAVKQYKIDPYYFYEILDISSVQSYPASHSNFKP